MLYLMSSARLNDGNNMAKLVLNIRKHKGNAGAVGNHIDRVKGMEHMYKNADPERLHLNEKFIANDYCKMKLSQAINERIKDGYKGKRKLRSDAVKSLGLVLTGSHEQMKAIFSSEKAKKYWLKQTFSFLVENFGKENIVRCELHMDERTPHLHAVVVPLTDDGRLSARERMGNKKRLRELRKAYADKLQGLGLDYGVERTTEKKATSTKISDFYSLIRDYSQEYQNKIKTLKTANFKKLTPRGKTLFLEELQKSMQTKKLTQEIFDQYLIKYSNSKGQRI